jgi:hypothetical protein
MILRPVSVAVCFNINLLQKLYKPPGVLCQNFLGSIAPQKIEFYFRHHAYLNGKFSIKLSQTLNSESTGRNNVWRNELVDNTAILYWCCL